MGTLTPQEALQAIIDGKIGKNPETYKEPELAQFLGD